MMPKPVRDEEKSESQSDELNDGIQYGGGLGEPQAGAAQEEETQVGTVTDQLPTLMPRSAAPQDSAEWKENIIKALLELVMIMDGLDVVAPNPVDVVAPNPVDVVAPNAWGRVTYNVGTGEGPNVEGAIDNLSDNLIGNLIDESLIPFL